MNKKYSWIAAAALLAALPNARAEAPVSAASSAQVACDPPVREMVLGQAFVMKAGETLSIKASDVLVTLLSMDVSWCPEGVQCVWNSDASIQLRLCRSGAKSPTLALGFAALPQTAMLWGYNIRFDDFNAEKNRPGSGEAKLTFTKAL